MKKSRLDIMLPVYYGNLPEIAGSIATQKAFYEDTLTEYDWRIVLAVNGPKPEQVIELAESLNREDKRITWDYVSNPGKGSGIVHAWNKSDADIMSYMDIDLSTDIKDFVVLVSRIREGYDVSIGSRYHPDSVVTRSLKRRIVSFLYHKLFMKIVLGAKTYTDGQCGFKAVSPRVVREVLPLVRNRSWFFESEMLYIAQRLKMRITEIPVSWTESEFSGISLYRAIWEFIRCGFGLRFRKIRKR
jgi:glycosyltransferase involved in cell wall biosynthesis